MLKLMSQPKLHSGFAVAAFVGAAYDWGKHDSIEELLISDKYFQHLQSDKRYVDTMTRATISLIIVL
jgi:hypothetical protein